MENLSVKGNVVLWTIGSQQWLLSYRELVKAYLSGKHPHTGRALSTASLNKIQTMIRRIIGAWWIPMLKSIKNYRKIPIYKLQGLKSSGIKLGSGKYATVYAYDNYAVKVINHRFYKHLPRIDGSIEAKIMNILRNKIVYTFSSPNIITMYQYMPDKKTDYIVLEKLDKTFWTFLQDGQSKDAVTKGIMLQVLFTLLILQHLIPGFRHNDLKVDNILLDYTPRKQKLTLRYQKYFWSLPANVPIVKIADFDYSCIPKLCENPKVGTEHACTFGCTAEPSSIYDVHLFLNSMYSHRSKMGSGLRDWLLAQLPEQVRGNENQGVKFGRLVKPEEYEGTIKTPLQMLTSRFFSGFRTIHPAYPLWGIK